MGSITGLGTKKSHMLSGCLKRHWNLGLEGAGFASVPVSFLEILLDLARIPALSWGKELFYFSCSIPQLQWVSTTSFRLCLMPLSPSRERGDGSGQHLLGVSSVPIVSLTRCGGVPTSGLRP